jgi:hypothetical protein
MLYRHLGHCLAISSFARRQFHTFSTLRLIAGASATAVDPRICAWCEAGTGQVEQLDTLSSGEPAMAERRPASGIAGRCCHAGVQPVRMTRRVLVHAKQLRWFYKDVQQRAKHEGCQLAQSAKKRTMAISIEFSLLCRYPPITLMDLFTFSCNHILTFVHRREQWTCWIVYWSNLKVTKEGKHGREALFFLREPWGSLCFHQDCQALQFCRLNGFHSKFGFLAVKSMCQSPGWVVCLMLDANCLMIDANCIKFIYS